MRNIHLIHAGLVLVSLCANANSADNLDENSTGDLLELQKEIREKKGYLEFLLLQRISITEVEEEEKREMEQQIFRIQSEIDGLAATIQSVMSTTGAAVGSGGEGTISINSTNRGLNLGIQLGPGKGLGSACIRRRIGTQFILPSGEVDSVSRSVGGFSTLSIDLPADVILHTNDPTGTDESVSMSADKNFLSHIATVVEAGSLKVFLNDTDNVCLKCQPGALEFLSNMERCNFQLTVTASKLSKIQLMDAATLSSSDVIFAPFFEVETKAASSLRLTVSVQRTLTVDVSGVSEVIVDGVAGEKAELQASGAGYIQAHSLVVPEITAVASGVAAIRCAPFRSLSAFASGAATVEYSGDPQLTTDVSGAASVELLVE